jgi:membrane peptidoglycan carboxypeptidase
MGLTAEMSFLSDWVCGPLVAQMARKYSSIIYTPEHFVEMLFLVEDKRFPVHFGIDPIAIVRAVAFNLRGGALQGASTIAQQVYTIQISRSGRISRSLGYKLRQIAWALGQSAVRGKAAILKEYVETVYWGRSYHGLDRAIEGYFRGTRTSLSVAQSFFLAERIAAPNRISVKRISNLLKRVPIKINLMRNGASAGDVARIYEQVYGCGGEEWQLLAR